MPINSLHPQYEAYADKWKRVRDAVAGQDAVHKARTKYLPKLVEQKEDDYIDYLTRSVYFNATGRTIDGMVGMVFRKPVELEDYEAIEPIIKDIDLKDNSLHSFAQVIISELLQVNRFGVLVEYPQSTGTPLTQAQASQLNLRPYASAYYTESIINWRYERVNNSMQPVMIVLKECDYDETDYYAPKEIEQWRELLLINGTYLQRIWQKNDRGDMVQIGDDIIPLLNGQPLPFIPFYAFGSEENSLDLCDAPILPLADVNLAHYRVTADYERGCHFSGLPTLLLAGITLDEGDKIYVGSNTAVVTSQPEAHGEYIEVNGNFQALENNLKNKERQMAALGSRILEETKGGVEAAETMKLRTNGEVSVLAAMAMLTSWQLTKMLRFMAQWSGIDADVKAKLNTDYNPVGMTAQELQAHVAAWQSGAISYKSLFMALKRGEVIADNTDYDEEVEEIANSTPNLAEDNGNS